MKLLLLSWPHSPHQLLKSLIWQGSISSAPSKERELRAASRSPSPAPDATWTRVDKKLRLASGPQPWYQEATTCIWVPARPWSPFILSTVKQIYQSVLPITKIHLCAFPQYDFWFNASYFVSLELLHQDYIFVDWAMEYFQFYSAHHTEGSLILSLPYLMCHKSSPSYSDLKIGQQNNSQGFWNGLKRLSCSNQDRKSIDKYIYINFSSQDTVSILHSIGQLTR